MNCERDLRHLRQTGARIPAARLRAVPRKHDVRAAKRQLEKNVSG